MHLGCEPASRTERFTSAAVATVATTFLMVGVFAATLHGPVPASIDKLSEEGKRSYENLTLVTGPPSVSARSPSSSALGVKPQRTSSPQLLARTSKVQSDSTTPAKGAEISVRAGATEAAPAPWQARWEGPAISARLQTRFPYFGEALKAVTAASSSASSPVPTNLAKSLSARLGKQASNSQEERDAIERAADLATIAARGAGLPMTRAMSGGGRIDSPLPFGGPSRKQRQRDSTINVETKQMLAEVQRRSDSVMAMRRVHDDSLASLEDSLRRMRGRVSTLP